MEIATEQPRSAGGEKETRRSSQIIFSLVILANTILIGYALLSENISWGMRAVIASVFAIFIALGLIATFSRWRLKFFRETQVTLLFALIIVALVDVAYLLAPGLFPLAFRHLMQDAPVAQQRVRVVDYLPFSPYAKPKPDVVIKIPGYYGPPDEFVYEWRTDRRGFKNSPAIAARETVPIVAVGDSFTEGMGVLTEQHWASQLSELGFATYTLGVQGYAPTQMAGAFEQWGLSLKPRYVLIGYLGNVSDRERYFAKPVEIENPEALPSAIQRLVHEDLALARRIRLDIPEPRQEIRQQYRFAASAAIALAVRLWRDGYGKIPAELMGGIPDPENDPRFMSRARLVADSEIKIGAMQRYRSEIKSALGSKLDREKHKNSNTWQSTLRKFSEIASSARKIGAQTIIVMFYNRGFVYAEHATGINLDSANANDVEASLLREFAARENIGFIDTKPAFDSAVKGITDSTPLRRYPYLTVDGHPSPFGHSLIAGQIADRLRSLGHRELR